MGGTQATNGPSKLAASNKQNTIKSNNDGYISTSLAPSQARAGSNYMLETPTSSIMPSNMSDDMLRQDTYSPTPAVKPKVNRFNMGDNALEKATTYQAPKPKVKPQPVAPKMPLAKSTTPKIPNPGNPYKSNVPKFDLGKVLAKKAPARKPAPKPMNNFVYGGFQNAGW